MSLKHYEYIEKNNIIECFLKNKLIGTLRMYYVKTFQFIEILIFNNKHLNIEDYFLNNYKNDEYTIIYNGINKTIKTLDIYLYIKNIYKTDLFNITIPNGYNYEHDLHITLCNSNIIIGFFKPINKKMKYEKPLKSYEYVFEFSKVNKNTDIVIHMIETHNNDINYNELKTYVEDIILKIENMNINIQKQEISVYTKIKKNIRSLLF